MCGSSSLFGRKTTNNPHCRLDFRVASATYKVGIGWIRTNYGTSRVSNHLITPPQSVDERPMSLIGKSLPTVGIVPLPSPLLFH